MQEQLELWLEAERKGYRLHQHLLAKGEKPDTRPWGGRFDLSRDKALDCADSCDSPNTSTPSSPGSSPHLLRES